MPTRMAQVPDNGCEIAPSCLECPLPRCHEELGGGIGQARRQLAVLERAADIAAAGMSPAAAAERYGVSERTVFRWLRFAEDVALAAA